MRCMRCIRCIRVRVAALQPLSLRAEGRQPRGDSRGTPDEGRDAAPRVPAEVKLLLSQAVADTPYIPCITHIACLPRSGKLGESEATVERESPRARSRVAIRLVYLILQGSRVAIRLVYIILQCSRVAIRLVYIILQGSRVARGAGSGR